MENFKERETEKQNQQSDFASNLLRGDQPTIQSHFSWIRTRLSIERTLMSWLRTATALIGFGFTIAQFLSKLNDNKQIVPPIFPHLPVVFGLSLIGVGTIALICACIEYRMVLRYMQGDEFGSIRGTQFISFTPTFPVAVFLSIVGIVTFASLVIRL